TRPSPSQNATDRDRDDHRLRTLVTMNADGLLVVGRDDGVVRFANPATAELLGRSPESLCGQPFGTPVFPAETTDIDINRSGEHRVAELRTAAIEWDGAPCYLVALRDVTEQRRDHRAYVELLEHERVSRHAAETAERR